MLRVLARTGPWSLHCLMLHSLMVAGLVSCESPHRPVSSLSSHCWLAWWSGEEAMKKNTLMGQSLSASWPPPPCSWCLTLSLQFFSSESPATPSLSLYKSEFFFACFWDSWWVLEEGRKQGCNFFFNSFCQTVSSSCAWIYACLKDWIKWLCK